MVEDTPDDMIHDLFTQSVWPDNPLGCSVLGTRENIRSINRAAIVGHVDKYYNAPEIVISVTGHFEHDPLIDLLTRHFGGLTKNGGRPETSSPSFRPGLYIKRKELEQVQICLGTSGLPQSDEDRFALYALNAILGSSMSSRLFQEIREDRGLVYSIYSYVTSFQDAGLFVVYAGCDGSNAAEVVRLIMASLADIKAKGVTEAELKRAKDQMKGNLMLSVESTSNRMSPARQAGDLLRPAFLPSEHPGRYGPGRGRQGPRPGEQAVCSGADRPLRPRPREQERVPRRRPGLLKTGRTGGWAGKDSRIENWKLKIGN